MDPQFPAYAVQIASGASLSNQLDIGGQTPVGLFVPATWTTAGISFQASPDGGATWGELVDETAAPVAVGSITTGTAVFVALDPTALRGVRSLKVRSGTAELPVDQTDAVKLTLLCRTVL